jgi:hypothetical protein
MPLAGVMELAVAATLHTASAEPFEIGIIDFYGLRLVPVGPHR